MDFSQVLQDLEKLEGLTLSSIRPGAELQIIKVDFDLEKVVISSKNKKVQSRPFSEFKKLWDEILNLPAIHVDEVLHGSGSSRNQPETILANLPYIEWLKVNNKKHIAFVNGSSHPFGTIKKMDSIAAEKIIEKLEGFSDSIPLTGLIVSSDVTESAKYLTAVLGKTPQAIAEGFYQYDLRSQRILLADSTKLGIPCGQYIELRSNAKPHFDSQINIAGEKWDIIYTHGMNLIIRD